MVNKQRHLKFEDLFKQNGWNGLMNRDDICLPDFVNQDPTWDNAVDKIQSLVDFNTFIQTKAEQFADWAIKQRKSYSRKDQESWFKGIIGEYFWVENGQDIISRLWDSLGIDYVFSHVVPASFYRLTPHTRVEFGDDFGVDLVAINRNDEVCVAQVKTWNIFGKDFITYGDIVANMFCDGIEREWIYHKQKESMFVLWLGKMKNIAVPLNSEGCPLYKKVQYCGFEQLDEVLNGFKTFFNIDGKFNISMKNIKTYNFGCDPKILHDIDLL